VLGSHDRRACAARILGAAPALLLALACACGAGRAAAQFRDAAALAAGRKDYTPCATCHGADGRSTVVPQYPKIGGQSAAYVINALKAYRDGRRQGTYAALMAAVAKPLTDAQIADLAAYIQSLGR
jgi:cytochrome c553